MVEEPHTQPSVTTPATLPALTNEEPHPEWAEWFKEHSIPICGVLLLLVAFCFVSHFRAGTGWSKAREIADTLAKATQVLAIIVGGWWGYFKFIKGRAYQETLIPTVSGKLLTIGSQTYLIVNIRVENVGQSVVEFAPNTSALRVFGYMSSTASEIITVKDNQLAHFVALNDRSLEPNEIIQKTIFMSIPVEVRLGLRLELEIISSHRKKYRWVASFLVEKGPSSGIIDPGNKAQRETT